MFLILLMHGTNMKNGISNTTVGLQIHNRAGWCKRNALDLYLGGARSEPWLGCQLS